MFHNFVVNIIYFCIGVFIENIMWEFKTLPAGLCWNKGQLFEIMKMVRNRFHHALRRVRRAADAIKSQKLFEAAMWGGGDLLQELKKTRGGRHTPDLPENVEGASGEEEICHKFRQVYSDLYNSADTTEEMVAVKVQVEENIDEGSWSEISKITDTSGVKPPP